MTTEIEPAGPFYYAEDYHQQYLHKVPNGYCGLKGTGVACTHPCRRVARARGALRPPGAVNSIPRPWHPPSAPT